MKKVRINFALTEEARNLLRDAAMSKGLSMTALLELMIREDCRPGRLSREKFGEDLLRRFDETYKPPQHD